MRWRLIDRITAYRRGEFIAGRIAVSFEQTLLPEPLGRDGVLPESLLVGAAAELALWAAGEASDWAGGAELAGIDDLRFLQPAVHAELLTLHLASDGTLAVSGDLGAAAAGRLEFAPVALAPLVDPRILAEDWEVLRAATA